MSASALRVVVAHRPPFVFVANSTGNPFYYGLLIDLLNKILTTSNGTLSYNIYVSPTNAGGSLTTSGWTGIVGELAKGRADVALFPLTRTAARLEAIDCTFSYLDQGIGLVALDLNKGPGPLSVLAPFEIRLWVTLLCTVIGVALIFWGLDRWGRWMRDKQLAAFKQAGAITDKEAQRAKLKGEQRRGGVVAVGVLYVVYCFFCLIVLSSYTANLTSFLSVQKSVVEISGLEDLVNKSAFLAVIPNGTNAAYFTSSYDALALQLRDRVRFCDTDTCLRWLREGRVAAFASDQPQLTYLAAQQPCDLAVVGQSFGPSNLVFGLQKNSPLRPLFDDALQRFAEDGTLTALRRAWFEGLSQCDQLGSQLGNTKLGIGQMLGAFVLLVAGVVVAFCIGTVENLRWWGRGRSGSVGVECMC
ncbi:hypothetical protein GPECTOR_59g614 [Gonium pectorale]|uniref:Ionotropic glutamate receptor C-terminal domain-containing protein n=1 Tax=Gonium pectorale TaxID=33097 RepID=A0A150G584_GONPE|nr:hypothetical protein GPECTOR_59g614 [Gonium pectorale]|eukprot:KXZ45007.1 hypothetical protein GPECTOR_59g614 [Gonium pectorale]